jgi:hypothetical protein
MKDKELKFEEIEVSHTLGGAGEGRKVVWRGEGSGDGVDATLLSNSLKYVNIADVDIGLVRAVGLPVCRFDALYEALKI